MATQIKDMVGSWAASPPFLYFQLREALDDPESSFKDFADIIGSDPALSARLLKIVNSPFYGYSTQVETITHALNIVGLEQLTDLALATVVISKFQGIPKEFVNMESFWVHSIAVGIAARKIGELQQRTNDEKLYLTGMLHDIGSLIIYKESPEAAREIFAKCQERNAAMYQVEQEVLGFDHAEVGGQLLAGWKLPQRIVEVVAHHHRPLEAKDFSVDACIVNLADCLVYELGIGNSGEHSKPEMDPQVLATLGFAEENIALVKELVPAQVDEFIRTFL